MRTLMIGLAVAAVISSGCAVDETATTEFSEATDTTTRLASTTTTTTTEEVAPVEWPGEGEPWDLLYISDSGGWGVADVLAERAADDVGVEVRVFDHASGGLSAATALALMHSDQHPNLSDWVRDAEIIIVYGNPEGSGADLQIGTCVSTSTFEREPPAAQTAVDYQPYRDILDELYAEIWNLREGVPTVLRAVDLYNPVISAWEAAGIEAECTQQWELWSGVIRDAAEANGAVMVSTYDLFNGPAHDEDPRAKGFIGPDGEHTTPEGAAAIADAIAAVGFDPASPPPEG